MNDSRVRNARGMHTPRYSLGPHLCQCGHVGSGLTGPPRALERRGGQKLCENAYE